MVWHTELSSTQKLVLLKLADCGDDKGKNIFPAVGTIAQQTGLYERTVRRTLKELREMNIIKIVKPADNRYQKTNVYAIDLKRLSIAPPVRETGVSQKQEPPVTETPTPCSSDTQTIIEPSINRDIKYIDEMKEIYNDVLGNILPACRSISATRRRKMQAIYKRDFNQNLSEWKEYCERILRCPFLIGDNDKGWMASFDWIIETRNLNKILEGNYEPRVSKIKPKQGADAMFAGFGNAVDKY